MKKLMFAFLLLGGCQSRGIDRFMGTQSKGKAENAPNVMYVLDCCQDNHNGVLTYPSFVPLAHAQLCEAAQIANRKDEMINNVVYIPMSVDCGHGHGHVGNEYYTGKGY